MYFNRSSFSSSSTSTLVLGSALALLAASALTPAVAHAKAEAGEPAPSAHVQPLVRADVVVNGTPPQPAPAPAPAPVVVQQQPAAPAVAPVAAPSRSTTVVEHENHNYMSTIAVSALMGGIAGVLVGGALYYLSDDQKHVDRILYWGAGGVLVGGAVGITQVVVQESRVDRATASRLPSDPAPTLRVALFQKRF